MGDNLTHEHLVPVHEAEFKRLNKRIEDEEAFTKQMIRISADQSASLERIHERLDDWGEQTKAILLLGHSVEVMANETTKIQQSVNEAMKILGEQNLRIHDIEREKFDERFEELETEYENAFIKIEEKYDVKLDAINVRFTDLENRAGKVALKYLGISLGVVITSLTLFLLYSITNGKIGG